MSENTVVRGCGIILRYVGNWLGASWLHSEHAGARERGVEPLKQTMCMPSRFELDTLDYNHENGCHLMASCIMGVVTGAQHTP